MNYDSIELPSKVLVTLVSSIVGQTYWPYDDGSNDPYWENGATPREYRWVIELGVQEQTHSSHRTREPFVYNGMDIKTGDYIASTSTGVSAKIISILEKSETYVKCIVEDQYRYNTFRNPAGNGNGIFPTSTNALVFSVNETGIPLLDPLPSSGVDPVFFANLISRFNNFAKDYFFLIEQQNHGFVIGDLLSADSDINGFVLTNPNNPFIIGTVSNDSLGPDYFMVTTMQKTKDDYDYLPGEVGDVLYADDGNPGEITTTVGSTPVLIKLREYTQSMVTGTVSGGSTSSGNTFKLNNVDITVGGAGDAAAMISAINGTSQADHGITASSINAENTAETSLSLAYGEVALFAPTGGPYASAQINGSTVTFTTNTTGLSEYAIEIALEQDMAEDINNANIPNISASTSGGSLIISNSTGGAITITNISTDTNGTNFAGSSSGSGIPLSTSATTDEYLKLTAIDARAINLFDTNGTPTADFGLYSVENGQKAAGLYIEQGLRNASTFVVADISSRDALSVFVGDNAYVMNKGDGEWGFYLYNGITWVTVATEESSKVDSDSYSVEISSSSSASGIIGEVNTGSRINFVTVSVTEEFDTLATITVGDSIVSDRLMTEDQNDLSVIGEYTITPTYTYETGSDTNITYSFNANGATSGAAKITISYN